MQKLAFIGQKKTVFIDNRYRRGKRGLRQSEALFQHHQNIPALLERVTGRFSPDLLGGIAVSKTPRPQPDSYLPVFSAGFQTARSIAAVTGLPIYETTHQEGHLRAALVDSGLNHSEFLGLHLSGGTTEVLRIKAKPGGFEIILLGGTSDLHAGQMVDRIGVALGLSFPAGPSLEKMASEGKSGKLRLPVAVHDLQVSFSGPVTAAERLLAAGAVPADLALAVQECLVLSLLKLLTKAIEVSGLHEILIFGGVAANTYLREQLKTRLTKGRVYFGQARLSSDNAVGVALLGKDKGGTVNGR
jgi:N6-L-threonylcarbamoyladenine synthase